MPDDTASRRPTRTTAATCGELVDLSRADGSRISRCGCGVIHLHVVASGVTLRLSPERFAALGDAVASARVALSADGTADEAPPIH